MYEQTIMLYYNYYIDYILHHQVELARLIHNILLSTYLGFPSRSEYRFVGRGYHQPVDLCMCFVVYLYHASHVWMP